MSALVEMFKQNAWANRRLLEACARLGAEALGATATGTYGSVADTLVHLLAAEQRYVTRISGPWDGDRLNEGSFPGIDSLAEHARRSGDALVALAESAAPDATVTVEFFDGKEYTMPAGVILVQAINHGVEHRSHVKTILSTLGVIPPEIDAWSYGEAAGLYVPVES